MVEREVKIFTHSYYSGYISLTATVGLTSVTKSPLNTKIRMKRRNAQEERETSLVIFLSVFCAGYCPPEMNIRDLWRV